MRIFQIWIFTLFFIISFYRQVAAVAYRATGRIFAQAQHCLRHFACTCKFARHVPILIFGINALEKQIDSDRISYQAVNTYLFFKTRSFPDQKSDWPKKGIFNI